MHSGASPGETKVPPPIDLPGLVLVEQAEHHNDYH